jgi:predicted molibdopterin-dependent oxidoreductase YjgC
MIHLTINGKPIEVPDETTVLRAAEMAGITIPTLCDHPHLTPYGGCRLCVVEVKGARLPMASCTLPVNEGMVVETETPALAKSRKVILELLLSTYHDAAYTDNAAETHSGAAETHSGAAETHSGAAETHSGAAETHSGAAETQLTQWVKHYGLDVKTSQAKQPRYPVDSDPNPFVRVDLNKCIVCTRCIRACAEVQGRFVWSLAERGYDTRIVAGADTDMLDGRCESCGACAAFCPTGALDHKMFFGVMPVKDGGKYRLVTTTCTYCGVGCNFDLIVEENKVVGVASNQKAPVNGMHTCVKGRYGYDFIHHPDRLTQPKVRRYLLEGGKKSHHGAAWEWVETDWDTALNLTAKKLAQTRDTSGPDSVGILTSAKCLNEENYLMNKLARQVIGTNNIDHCARL